MVVLLSSICEKVARCEEILTLNVKIDATCEKRTLNLKKIGSLNVLNISYLKLFFTYSVHFHI